MLRYKLSAKIMFFFEIIAIPKRKNVIFAEKFEKSSKKRKELERNQVTKLKE